MIESKGNTVHRMNLVEASWRNHEKNPRSSHTFFSSHSHFYAQGLLWLTRRCLLVEKLKLPHDSIEVLQTDSISQQVIRLSITVSITIYQTWLAVALKKCITDPIIAKLKCVADMFKFLKSFLTSWKLLNAVFQWQFCTYSHWNKLCYSFKSRPDLIMTLKCRTDVIFRQVPRSYVGALRSKKRKMHGRSENEKKTWYLVNLKKRL